jgi:hypothetical protein
MRQFFGPDAQRIVDNEAVRVFTDDALLADRLAPVDSQQKATPSAQMAMLMTERLMRGLPVELPKEAVPDDYVTAWLGDMAAILNRIFDSGGVATREDLAGLGNMAAHIQQLIPIIAQDESARERAREYGDALNQLGNIMKGLAQQLQESEKAKAEQNGGNGQNAELQAKLQAELIKAQSKAEIQKENAAAKGGQRQAAFELEEARKDRRQEADLRRQARQTEADITLEEILLMSKPTKPTESPNANSTS